MPLKQTEQNDEYEQINYKFLFRKISILLFINILQSLVSLYSSRPLQGGTIK